MNCAKISSAGAGGIKDEKLEAGKGVYSKKLARRVGGEAWKVGIAQGV